MIQYPSIGKEIVKGSPYYVFPKYDGSNVRCEWTKKKGFDKFGSRKVLIGQDSSELGNYSIRLIKEQEEEITKCLVDNKLQDVTLFFEFYGEKSFAGVHDYEDPTLKVTLIDMHVYKKGFVLPQEFIKTFKNYENCAPVIYHGNITQELCELVSGGKLEGMTFEGVIAKGAPLKRGYPPHMLKIKSTAWVDKVKSLYTDPKTLEDLL